MKCPECGGIVYSSIFLLGPMECHACRTSKRKPVRLGLIINDGSVALTSDTRSRITRFNYLGDKVDAERLLGAFSNEWEITPPNGEWERGFTWRPPKCQKVSYEHRSPPRVPPEIIDRKITPERIRAVQDAKARYTEYLESKKDKRSDKKSRFRKKKYRLKGDPPEES